MLKFFTTLTVASLTMASPASALSEVCIEQVTDSVIDYLAQEVTSVYTVLKTNNEISGIRDGSGSYADFVLLPITKDASGKETVVFQSGPYIVWTEVLESTVNGKISCDVATVEWAQDDQD